MRSGEGRVKSGAPQNMPILKGSNPHWAFNPVGILDYPQPRLRTPS
jgi:hypothetical protein